MTALEVLEQASLFKGFGTNGLSAFAEIARARRLPPGAQIFMEDAEGDSLFVVGTGTVRIVQHTGGGTAREIGTIGAGGHLGDLGLLTRTVRLVSAVAATECEVVELARRDFFKLAQKKPVTCLKLAAVIAGELARHVGDSRQALRGLALPKG